MRYNAEFWLRVGIARAEREWRKSHPHPTQLEEDWQLEYLNLLHRFPPDSPEYRAFKDSYNTYKAAIRLNKEPAPAPKRVAAEIKAAVAIRQARRVSNGR